MKMTPLPDLTADEAEARLDAVKRLLAEFDIDEDTDSDPDLVANVKINTVCLVLYGAATVLHDGSVKLVEKPHLTED